MSIAVYTLTSTLHDEKAVSDATRVFLGGLGMAYVFRGSDFSDYGSHDADLIYVRTGGTEGIFQRLLPQLRSQSQRPFLLLTSGKSNSLAASMEILSYLRQQGLQGEIIHASNDYVAHRIQLLERVGEALRTLRGCRLGIIGQPSDWLISSHADAAGIQRQLGISLIDIPMQELLDEIAISTETSEVNPPFPCGGERCDVYLGAVAIYNALKSLIVRHQLQGFTLRCFDLLTAVRNTGCWALAKLNAEGYVAGCEGDVPAMLSMMIGRALSGVSGFQANPASINPETGEMFFAHCTIPLNMVERYELDTHFESGIGVGIRGYMKEGPVTLFKVAGDLSRCFIAEGQLLRNQSEPDLCRTQQVIRLADPSLTRYFLTCPIGNHHIIFPGHHREEFEELITTINPIVK
ncbi:MAG: hypothetical protein IKX36_05345 [Prevotella sp.]|nr:hypothetical protein [Prevotella sp.]